MSNKLIASAFALAFLLLASSVVAVHAAQDDNSETSGAFYTYVQVTGTVTGTKVSGFAWESQATCSSSCVGLVTGLTLSYLFEYYNNSVWSCIVSCNGAYVADGPDSQTNILQSTQGPSGSAREVLDTSTTGLWDYLGGTYTNFTEPIDAGLPNN